MEGLVLVQPVILRWLDSSDKKSRSLMEAGLRYMIMQDGLNFPLFAAIDEVIKGFNL